MSNLVVILQEQASVDGTIVDGNAAPVPLARRNCAASAPTTPSWHDDADEVL
jgi:hypothetical protein